MLTLLVFITRCSVSAVRPYQHDLSCFFHVFIADSMKDGDPLLSTAGAPLISLL